MRTKQNQVNTSLHRPYVIYHDLSSPSLQLSAQNQDPEHAKCIKLLVEESMNRIPWPEMTDIINIPIRCKFAYHVEFGFICED